MKERKRNRLKGFDYSSSGIYFLTICCQNREHWLGKINDKKMELNENGTIVHQQLEWLPQQYPYFKLRNYVIMPNHIHILAEIAPVENESIHEIDLSGDGDCTDRSRPVPIRKKIKSISEIIGAFKTTSSKKIHLAGNTDFQWQRSFHDHIVKTRDSYERIYTYITQNPEKWEDDQLFNPETILA